MSPFILYIFAFSFISLSFESGYCGFIAAPLAVCDDKDQFETSDWDAVCPTFCPREENISQVNVYLLSIDQSYIKEHVIVCKRIEIKQVFEMTWSFSKIEHTPLITSLHVGVSEARDFVSVNCPNYDCDFLPDLHIDPEYHWASDTLISREVITCHKYPTVAIYHVDKFKLRFSEGAHVDFDIGVYREDDTSIVLWNTEMTHTGDCAFTKGKQMTCTGGVSSSSYDCPSAALHLSNLTFANYFKCPYEVYETSDGIFVGSSAWNKSENTTPVVLDESSFLDSEVKYLASQSNKIILSSKREHCLIRCVLESFVISSNTERLRWISLSNKIVTFGMGTWRVCQPALDCRVSNSSRFCAEKNSIEILCGINKYWWDLHSSYVHVQRSTNCTMSNLLPNEINAKLRGFMNEMRISSNGTILTSPTPLEYSVYYPLETAVERSQDILFAGDYDVFSSKLENILARTLSMPILTNKTVSSDTFHYDYFSKLLGGIEEALQIPFLMLLSVIVIIFLVAVYYIIKSFRRTRRSDDKDIHNVIYSRVEDPGTSTHNQAISI